MDEKWMKNPGCVQAWLTQAASQHDEAEVKRRLEQVPESMREQVTIHARGVWQLASQIRR